MAFRSNRSRPGKWEATAQARHAQATRVGPAEHDHDHGAGCECACDMTSSDTVCPCRLPFDPYDEPLILSDADRYSWEMDAFSGPPRPAETSDDRVGGLLGPGLYWARTVDSVASGIYLAHHIGTHSRPAGMSALFRALESGRLTFDTDDHLLSYSRLSPCESMRNPNHGQRFPGSSIPGDIDPHASIDDLSTALGPDVMMYVGSFVEYHFPFRIITNHIPTIERMDILTLPIRIEIDNRGSHLYPRWRLMVDGVVIIESKAKKPDGLFPLRDELLDDATGNKATALRDASLRRRDG